MKKFVCLTLSILILNGCAYLFAGDYRAAQDEYNSNKPPEYYEESITPNLKPLSQGGKDNPLTPFSKGELGKSKTTEEEEIRARGERWLDVIKTDNISGKFYTVDPIIKQRIGSEEAVDSLLKEEVTLDLLLSIAAEKNPGLLAAKKGWESAVERYPQTVRLDNILRQYQSFTQGIDTVAGDNLHISMIAEKFPFPGILALKGDIVEREVLIAKETYLIALRDLIVKVNKIYDDIIFINTAIQLNNEKLRLLKELESVAALRYSTRNGNFSDVLSAQIEIARQMNEIENLNEEKKVITARINKELNRPVNAPLGEVKRTERHTMLHPIEEAYQTAVEYNQDIRLSNLKIEAENLMITMSERELYKDMTRGFSYVEGDKEMGEKLPKVNAEDAWFGGRYAYLREAKINYKKMFDELSELKNSIFLDIKDMHFNIARSERENALYKNSLIPKAMKGFNAARSEYETGKIGFLELLNDLSKLIEFNIEYNRAFKDYNQNFCDLERIMGRRM